MLFDINSCCSICPSEIFLNVDLEGELVYIFTEPDTGKQLPISEECCEIIGGKNLSQGDEYTGCDACVTYTQSNDFNSKYSYLGILNYEGYSSIKLSDEILSTCCGRKPRKWPHSARIVMSDGRLVDSPVMRLMRPSDLQTFKCGRMTTHGRPFQIQEHHAPQGCAGQEAL